MHTGGSRITPLRAGFCLGYGRIASPLLPRAQVRFYARSFLIEHSKHGLLLVDTGYGESFWRATARFPSSLYRHLLPVQCRPEDRVIAQLHERGLNVRDLSYVILTHFHADHIGALHDFAEVPWIYRSDSLAALQQMSSWRALRHGFLHDLIPFTTPPGSILLDERSFSSLFKSEGYGERSSPSECEAEPRKDALRRRDLFGDGSLWVVDLPGHALGHCGLLLPNALMAGEADHMRRDLFLVGDAAWSQESLEYGVEPGFLGRWAQQDSKAYRRSFHMLHQLHSTGEVFCIPTHEVELCIS